MTKWENVKLMNGVTHMTTRQCGGSTWMTKHFKSFPFNLRLLSQSIFWWFKKVAGFYGFLLLIEFLKSNLIKDLMMVRMLSKKLNKIGF